MDESYQKIKKNYDEAKAIYGQYGIDTDQVLRKLNTIPVSIHCWQGDDLTGFEKGVDRLSGGGILATGQYPGKARNGAELRQDLEKALSLIPGKHRLSLHAVYAETGGKAVDRDELTAEHFRQWIEWARQNDLGLDFNPTYFSHPLAGSGYTLSSKDEKVRAFWIRHTKRCREIAAQIGAELNTPCINNIWIPDGSKDLPADRMVHRRILKESLDEIFVEQYEEQYLIDAVESKLFGIGSESYVVGSHEFYLGYALTHRVIPCLDTGHFHPTESIADKISALLTFKDQLLLHVSRGVRWDSDHVVILNDDLIALCREIARCNAYGRVHFGLDYFDASINRITAWVVGARAALQAIMISLLEPTGLLLKEEDAGNYGNRLALMEGLKTLPYYAVWRKYCCGQNMPAGTEWIISVKDYEDLELRKRV